MSLGKTLNRVLLIEIAGSGLPIYSKGHHHSCFFLVFYEIHRIRYSIADLLIKALDSRESSLLIFRSSRPEVKFHKIQRKAHVRVFFLIKAFGLQIYEKRDAGVLP